MLTSILTKCKCWLGYHDLEPTLNAKVDCCKHCWKFIKVV